MPTDVTWSTTPRRPAVRFPLSTIHTAYAVPPTITWLQRATTCESIPRTYLGTGFAAAAQGEAVVPLTDIDRIPRALAGWDIQAHRTLAGDPRPANLALIAHTQSFIAAVAIVLLDASPPPTASANPARLRRAIAAAGESWGDLAARWTDLTRPSHRLDPPLARTAAELRAAYQQFTHDTTTRASPEAIAARPGLDRAVSTTLHALEAGADLANTLQERARVGSLTGPARALSRRAHNDVADGLTNDPNGDTVWVSPSDIHAKRSVPLPRPVAEGLQRVSDQLVAKAESAAAAAGVTSHSATTQPQGGTTTRLPRRGQPAWAPDRIIGVGQPSARGGDSCAILRVPGANG